jgi:hypothetical protein
MTDSGDREFWLQMIACLEAQAQLIQDCKLTPPPPGRVFDPSMGEPKAEKQFWQTWRRNLLSTAALIKTSKIGGSSGVKFKRKRRQYRQQRLDRPPGERT